jgi:hypothetical protein
MMGLPPEPTPAIRGPDFIQFSFDLYVANFSGTFSRSGNAFFGGGFTKLYLVPSDGDIDIQKAFLGASINVGWLIDCMPSNQDVDDFIDGFGMGFAGFYSGVGGGFAWSPGSGNAILFGVGAGLSVNPGSLQSNQGQTGLGGW